MKKLLGLFALIFAVVFFISGIAAAARPLRDQMISGKVAEAKRLLNECTRMGKISRPASRDIRKRIRNYREHALNTEIRNGGIIPRHEAEKISHGLDDIIRDLTAQRNAPPPPPPGPPPAVPPPPPPPGMPPLR
ncbi:MAG: hypothetical protein HQK99_00060 [Nitrospirae bacterium]|nr:hypothetical protein [Nitrospirota bacterium]